MFDINFYMKVHDLKYRVMNGENFSKEFLVEKLEEYRSHEPVVYNIETTNACNMRCEMCPRTTMMTRPIETLDKDQFDKIIAQLRPWTPEEWKKWESFVQEKHGIAPDDMGLYCLSSLGRLGMALGQFPVERFHQLLQNVFSLLRTQGLTEFRR